MEIKNDIKAHIVGAGMTMSEVLKRLAKEYGWSNSVLDLCQYIGHKKLKVFMQHR